MGCVQRAVLEFDEEVRAPWRPRLVSELPVEAPAREPASSRTLRAHPSRRGVLRVGACHTPASAGRPAAAVSTTAAARVGRGPRTVGIRWSRRRLRLTRRARRLALVLALVAGIALGSWLAPLFGVGVGSGLRLAGETSVVVRPGDTLWSIASPVAADGDVRAVVAEIRQLNGLSRADLVPGQTLQLP